MATVNVPRAELAALVGLSHDVDDETLNAAIANMVGQRQAREAAVARATAEARAEARLQAEDRQIVAAAINSGKINSSRAQFWVDALKRERPGNRAIIASLASGLPPAEKVAADADLERVHDGVMARLGLPAGKPAGSARTVAASQHPAPLPPTPMVDSLGIPIPGVPAPVRLVRGKDPAHFTSEERDNGLLYALGGQFAAAAAARGIPRAPGAAGYYQPSPNDHSYYDEAAGEWRSKDGWERGVHGIGI